MPGRRLALILANNLYDDESLSELVFPTIDADELQSVLQDAAIGGFSTTVLVNQTHDRVRKTIEAFARNASIEDLLLLYFSGHGVKDARGSLFLAASDTQKDLLLATGVEASFVSTAMARSRARRQVVILDCCFSGAFPVGLTARSADSAVHVGEQFDGRGRVVLASSSSLQYSFETGPLDDVPPAATGSFFTNALIAGLRTGEADRNRDGQVTVEELYDFLFEQVTAATPHQTPELSSTQVSGDIIIAANPFHAEGPPGPRDTSDLARAARARLLVGRLDAVKRRAENPSAESRLPVVDELEGIVVQAQHIDSDVRGGAIDALEALGLDGDAVVAEAAQSALARLSDLSATSANAPVDTDRDPGGAQESPPEPVPSNDKRRWPLAVVGTSVLIVFVTLAMFGALAMFDNGPEPDTPEPQVTELPLATEPPVTEPPNTDDTETGTTNSPAEPADDEFPLMLGSDGGRVGVLNAWLLGKPPGSDLYTLETVQAVKEWQDGRGQDASGRVDRDEFASLYRQQPEFQQQQIDSCAAPNCEGEFIKTPDDIAVYRVVGGSRLRVIDPEQLRCLGGDFDQLVVISEEKLYSFPFSATPLVCSAGDSSS